MADNEGNQSLPVRCIGVQIFLFLSGWLQTDKNVGNISKWLQAKRKRIILPFYVGLVLLVVIRSLLHCNVEGKAILLYLFNLQGLGNIFKDISVPGITGYGQTWFLTVLMVCYLLTILVKRLTSVDHFIRHNIVFSFILTVAIQMILAVVHLQIGGIVCYFFGYYCNHSLKGRKKEYFILTTSAILLMVVRFVVHRYYDNTIFYDSIIFTWSFNLLGIWASISMMHICNRFESLSRRIATHPNWRILDFYSYPLFLAHYMFLRGELSIEQLSNYTILQGIFFLLLSVSAATLIATIADSTTWRKLIRTDMMKKIS